MLANAAFYFGLIRTFAEAERPVWSQLPYEAAERNFYLACYRGLSATLHWPRVGETAVGDLVLERLLPAAYEGLDAFGVNPATRDRLLGHHRAAVPHRTQRRGVAERDRGAARGMGHGPHHRTP